MKISWARAWKLVGLRVTERSADPRSEGFTGSPNYQFEVNLKSKNGVISSLRCVCVCEVAVNSKGVKTTEKTKSVPDTYLVVTNDDSVIGKVYKALHSLEFIIGRLFIV